MSNSKLNALQDLIDIPKSIYKLQLYERKLHDASTSLLFESRTIVLHTVETSKINQELFRLTNQLRTRVDSLIDQSRMFQVRIRPGKSEKEKKTIYDNAILYDLIIFSRCWDLKTSLGEFDSQIIFDEKEKLNSLAREILENIQTIDNLFSQKENVTTTVQSSEEIARSLLEYFNKELDFADNAGALKGILKLDKPKLIGKGKYYDQLGNIILKITMSFELESASDPIALRDIFSRLNREFPNINADMKDLQKVLEELSDNGLLILEKDRKGLFWVRLQPAIAETNVILQLAKENGFVTVEELLMISNWSLDEALEEMEKFVKAGLAIKDASYASGTKYYFPGLTDS